MDVFNTAATDNVFHRDPSQINPHGLGVYTRMGLMPGHCSCPVVKDYQGEFVVIMYRIYESGDARVEKCRISDK